MMLKNFFLKMSKKSDKCNFKSKAQVNENVSF